MNLANQTQVSPELPFFVVPRPRAKSDKWRWEENVSFQEAEDYGNEEVVLVKMVNN